MDSAGSSAEGYSRRLRDVEESSRGVDDAERHLKATLLDSRAGLDDIKAAEDRLTESRKRHTSAVSAERDAHRALSESMGAVSGSMGVTGRAVSALAGLMPKLHASLGGVADASEDATGKLGSLTTVIGLFGPWGKAAAVGIGAVTSAASALSGATKDIGAFELAFGKIAGLTLAVPSIGGLAGLGGAAGVQGLVEMAGAAKQLSGALGLLPAVMGAVELSSATLKVAFNGVDSALQDMMADDPKKFLEDIKDMAPFAAQAMLQVASFRDGFKGAGAAVQQTFFAQIVNDIGPLIQTWLPAVTTGMVKIAEVFGEAAHQLAYLLNLPQMSGAFTVFVNNVVTGLQAMTPALSPLLQIFTNLAVVGSSFFGQIGGQITEMLTHIADALLKAENSGKLQSWIQDGINAFEHLANIAWQVGEAFLNVMDIADKFGGGGLLAWLEDISRELNTWTQSSAGQAALAGFFATLRAATDAFLPMLPPLVAGLSAIGTAFTGLGVAMAPGWQAFFDSFAASMAQLAPQIVALGPALGNFVGDVGSSLAQLATQLGPELPAIFQTLSDAFRALLPQLGPLSGAFVNLVEGVGPELPGFFASVMSVLQALLPYLPLAVNAVSNLLSIFSALIEAGSGVINFFTTWLKKLGEFLRSVPGAFTDMLHEIEGFFDDFGNKALDWGKRLIDNLVKGIKSGVGSVTDAVTDIGSTIYDHLFTNSPARKGPLHDTSPDEMGGSIVRNFAKGMNAASPAAAAAVSGAAGSVADGLSGAGGGAPSPGGSGTTGRALLPDNIAGADTSILTAYLRHQFDDSRGLKGLAKDLGGILDVAQSGFNLVNQHVVQPMFQALGMLPGAKDQAWRKMTPEELASQQQAAAQKDAAKKGPDWQDVLGPGASPGTSAGSNSFPWDKVAAAESSGNWQNADTGGNGHFGGLQFSPETWKMFGGQEFSPMPNQATREQQIAVANRTAFTGYNGVKPQGLGAWEAITKGMVPGVNVNTPPTGPPGTPGPSWGDVVGGNANAASGAANGLPIAANPASRAGTLGGASANYTPATMAAAGIAPLFTKSGPGSMAGAPAWVSQLAEQFHLTPTSHQDKTLHGGTGQMGDWAFDFAGAVPDMQRFADFIKTSLTSQTLQAIWQNPQTGQQLGVAGGQVVGPGQYYTTPGGSYADHTDHVHWATDVAPLFNGAQPPGVGDIRQGATAVGNSNLVLPSGQTLGAIADNTSSTATTNDKLLQSYLQGNPALAQQIDAAKTPGAPDATVMDTLGGITTTINDLKTQDAIGNKNTIDALQNQQRDLATQQGFTQGPGALQQAQSIAGSIASGISGVFQTISSGLDALAGTQDIADRLVYGIRNTEDISKIVDDVQKYIKYASDLIGTIGSLVSAAGSFTGGADMGGTSAAGSALSMISSVLAGVNAAIDFGQQVYELTMGYVGKFMSVLTGLGGGTNLMGNVGFLLNKNEGTLISYSQDNPQNQNTSKVPSWMNTWYDYNGKGNPNPQVNQQLNVYAGPGQSPAAMMNETMWMVNTSGTSGALAPANF